MRVEVRGDSAVQVHHDHGKALDFNKFLLMIKYLIFPQRFAGSFFDTDGAVLVRLEPDGPAKTSGPYIAAKEFNK